MFHDVQVQMTRQDTQFQDRCVPEDAMPPVGGSRVVMTPGRDPRCSKSLVFQGGEKSRWLTL